jgi:hypothetical protein
MVVAVLPVSSRPPGGGAHRRPVSPGNREKVGLRSGGGRIFLAAGGRLTVCGGLRTVCGGLGAVLARARAVGLGLEPVQG